jgi:hypothetical protein
MPMLVLVDERAIDESPAKNDATTDQVECHPRTRRFQRAPAGTSCPDISDAAGAAASRERSLYSREPIRDV